jgi:hypothetical protein
MSENEEIEKVDPLDRTTFPEEFFDMDDDYNIQDIDLIKNSNIVENVFLENKRFKFDEENYSNNNNNNNINSLRIKQFSNKGKTIS